jgi:hypothetical protein
MVFKKKEKGLVDAGAAPTEKEMPAATSEEVVVSKEDVRVELPVEEAAVVAGVVSGRLTQVEIDTAKEMLVMLGNLLRQSNNPLMRRDVKRYIAMLTGMANEAPAA